MASRKILGNLASGNTAFFVCDIQERFRPAIKYFKEIVEVGKRMVDAAKILDIPLVVTEQYPKGLGSTVAELGINPSETEIFPKTVFSMAIPEVEEKMKTICSGQLKSIVLFGIEAHVCIQQTTIDLLERGYEVHLVADATSSRSQMDRLFAYERLRQAGAIVTTSEAVLLQLLAGSKHPKFKEVQALIKNSAPTSGLVIEDRLATDVKPSDDVKSSAKI